MNRRTGSRTSASLLAARGRRLAALCLATLATGFGTGHAATYFLTDFDNANPAHREDLQGGQIDIVDNPGKDAVNSSQKVGRTRVNNGGKRAEFCTSRLPTNERTYRYSWMYYIPAQISTADLGWRVMSQWKTYPCEVCTNYANEICGGCGGIFDEMRLTGGNFHFSWRAKPDCRAWESPQVLGRWVSFRMEVYWTNTTKGYVKLWKDGVPVSSHVNIKTLFDRFPSNGSCDIYWCIGLYGPLRGADPTADVYIDNMSVTDVGPGDDTSVVRPPDTSTVPLPPGSRKLAIVSARAGSEEAGNPVANVHDGGATTRWANDNTAGNAWVIVDLGVAKNVQALSLKLNNGATRTVPLAISVGIDSLDEVLRTTTLRDSGMQNILVSETAGRYVKVEMPAPNSDGTNWFSLYEVEVWGRDADPVSVTLPNARGRWALDPIPGGFRIHSPIAQNVEIRVADARGARSRSVYRGWLQPGTQDIAAPDLPAGTYVAAVRTQLGRELHSQHLRIVESKRDHRAREKGP